MTQSVHGIFWVQLLFWTIKEAPGLDLVSANKSDRTCKQQRCSATEIVKEYRKSVRSNINMKVKAQENEGSGGRQTSPLPGVEEIVYWEGKYLKGQGSATLLGATERESI